MSNLVLPTCYLPNRTYFSHLKNNDEITIEIFESFQKQTTRNRTFIYAANGIQTLSIPLSNRKNHQLTRDITIDYSTRWQDIHWKAIESAYNSSPFFLYYKDELNALLFSNENYLVDFNLNLINWLIKKIKLTCSIEFTESFENMNNTILYKDLIYKQYQKSSKVSFENNDYFQVFQDKHGYLENLSIVDLLFNEGPNTSSLI